jgi:hypothetical protein
MPITSVNSAYQINSVQSKPVPQSPAPSAPAAQKPDSVHLSAAAKAAVGDVDHDGDSH